MRTRCARMIDSDCCQKSHADGGDSVVVARRVIHPRYLPAIIFDECKTILRSINSLTIEAIDSNNVGVNARRRSFKYSVNCIANEPLTTSAKFVELFCFVSRLFRLRDTLKG